MRKEDVPADAEEWAGVEKQMEHSKSPGRGD